jgi:hypothetical protein
MRRAWTRILEAAGGQVPLATEMIAEAADETARFVGATARRYTLHALTRDEIDLLLAMLPLGLEVLRERATATLAGKKRPTLKDSRLPVDRRNGSGAA